MKERNIYLKNTPLKEAKEKFFTLFTRGKSISVETIKTTQSLQRITANPVFANISSPHYHASAMDGYAVKAEETFGASETNPKSLRIDKDAYSIDTGQPLPLGTNAVIMIEDVKDNGKEIEIRAATTPWQHVRSIGEDIVATEMIIPSFHKIRPVDLGALLASGVKEVAVLEEPIVGIIPTGTELINPREIENPKPGQVLEYNSSVFQGLIEEWGGQGRTYPSVPDDLDIIKKSILAAAKECHIVLVSAGSSAGSKDYTAMAIKELGELLVHGVAIKPGKPMALGNIDGKPIIGVPGYPVAAFICLDQFLKPLIAKLTGQSPPERPIRQGYISRSVHSSLKSDEFIRVKIGKVEEKLMATPLSRGSGVIMSLVKADGLVRIPQLKEGLEAGEKVTIELLRPYEDIDGTMVCIGSHDLSLDIIADLLHKKFPGKSLASTHVGSIGGIMSLRRKEAHLAGSHLLDEETGVYNLPYLKKFLPNEELVVMTLVSRTQGLLVKKGNPHNIRGLESLREQDISFINRQKGAGTRLLLDYKLKELGIDSKTINGYQREEFNHLAVAAAVKAGSADTGMAIMAAAKALDLDFIPVGKEEYHLIIPENYFRTEKMKCLLDTIKSVDFAEQIEGLGGYDASDRGKIVFRGKPADWKTN